MTVKLSKSHDFHYNFLPSTTQNYKSERMEQDHLTLGPFHDTSHCVMNFNGLGSKAGNEKW